MRIAGSTAFPNVGAMHREFAELTVQAKRWDQRFETATGTYPTHEFAAGYRSFTDRLLRAQKQADASGSIVSYEFERLADTLWSKYVGATSLVHSRLEHMADRRVTFKPYSGSFGLDVPWGSLLDGLISDLERGERMLYAKLITSPPSAPATPNPGVPTYPTWPGAPQPTPLP